MYIFEAHYTNMKTNEVITRTIEFEGDNFLDSEKECFLYAMEKAYDMIGENESFSSLEFIACQPKMVKEKREDNT